MKTTLLLLGSAALFACRQSQDPPRTAAANAPSAATAVRTPTVAFYPVGVRPRAITAADFNGDGRSDVAVASLGDGLVTVLFGDGSGRLGGSRSFVAGREPGDIEAVDIDGDGDADLVVANHETPNVTVLLNHGTGQFAPAPGSPFTTGSRPHVHGLATGDFDGDGRTDVAVESADTREIRILRGAARGLSPAVTVVAVPSMPYSRLGVGRVIGNGPPNILVPGHGDSTVRVIERAGNAWRLAEQTIRLVEQPWMVVGGDVNGDTRDDIIVVESDAVSIFYSIGRVDRATHVRFPIHGATDAAVGDLDGDGAADVAVGPWDGQEVTVLAGQPLSERRVRMCERPIGLAIADLDGDGRGELLATCTHANTLAVVTLADTPDARAPAAEARRAIPAADTFAAERAAMVDQQIRARGITSASVLRAMRKVPRHRFVPPSLREMAYEDRPLPIGKDQTISQPYIVAYMTDVADVALHESVLEIGTGSGYQAAVLSEVARQVYTIEIIPELAEQARQILDDLGYSNITAKTGNGYLGWPEHAPFDAILVTAAPDEVPQALVDQLAVGGRMVIPVGVSLQYMTIIEKTPRGVVTRRTIPVRFVPMTGAPPPGDP